MCQDGYQGVPSDLNIGCQPERSAPKNECTKDQDCSRGLVCNQNPETGYRKCVNLCTSTACGANEVCTVDEQGAPVCECKPGGAVFRVLKLGKLCSTENVFIAIRTRFPRWSPNVA
ncbi:uncharacterized protein LOC108253098 [Diaphorina citri]|uniref:Uncharacterized protein LOC108253098 n=1 Tax=Diaphorina citri TaxID=121845 RepID=A0A3Q0J9E9_DIACI|nr:uncharacterized protein LOC108253098 [Diaphorina citri]